MTSLVVTKENFNQIREEGIGNGFSVINPADGFRKDNRLWFGTCSECGESVTNSSLTGKGWEHNLILEQKFHESGTIAYQSSRNVDYCPSKN
jgi:hypothetical protein